MLDAYPPLTQHHYKGNPCPGDIDGLVERDGKGGNPDKILLIEIKNGDPLTVGQERTLKGVAKIKGHPIQVLVVNNTWADPVDGRRPFDPESYYEILPDGTFGPEIQTNLLDFSKRYDKWYRTYEGSLTAFEMTP
jgi:hypothetical protein